MKLDPVPSPPDYRALFEVLPDRYLIVTRDLIIVAASDAYLAATMTVREEILGQHFSDAFPDNPANADREGLKNLRASLEQVLATKKPHTMPVQRYDLRTPIGYEERYWSPRNVPLLNAEGEVTHLIHRVEDVTEFVRLTEKTREQERAARASHARQVQLEAEILSHEQDLLRAELERELSHQITLERQRIARELHDTLRQQLVGIQMLAANLHKKLQMRNVPEAQLMGDFTELLREANTQTRQLIHELMPVQIEPDALLSALRRSAFNIEQWYGISCNVITKEEGVLPDVPTATHLHYLAQEAMTNAAKHSGATAITVALTHQAGMVVLEVRDDGKGLPQGYEKRGGHGITSMRHRAQIIGADLDIHPAVQGGTVVQCRLNL